MSPKIILQSPPMRQMPLAKIEAFGRGLDRHGIPYTVTTNYRDRPDCDLFVVWGGHFQHATAKRMLRICLGFVGDREKFSYVGFDDLNGQGVVSKSHGDRSRWEAHEIELLPWRGHEFGPALIAAQLPEDATMRAIFPHSRRWYEEAIGTLLGQGRDVVWRSHPKGSGRWKPIPTKSLDVTDKLGPLALDLLRSKLVVAYSSNTLVDALIAGCGVVAGGSHAMAWPLAAYFPDVPLTQQEPDRLSWASDLAYAQWTEQELASGETWANLSPLLHS